MQNNIRTHTHYIAYELKKKSFDVFCCCCSSIYYYYFSFLNFQTTTARNEKIISTYSYVPTTYVTLRYDTIRYDDVYVHMYEKNSKI